MIISILDIWKRCESIGNVSSFIVNNSLGSPALFGLEYRLETGTVWTIAREQDDDFYKIMENSGILSTLNRMPLLLPFQALCTPYLGKGVPRLFEDVTAVVVKNQKNDPFFLAFRDFDASQFQFATYETPYFKEILGQLKW